MTNKRDETDPAEVERILMATGQITGPGRPEIGFYAGVDAMLKAGEITEDYLWAVACKVLRSFWDARGNPLVRDMPALYQYYRDHGVIQFHQENLKQLVIVCDGARCYFYTDEEARTKAGYASAALPLKAQCESDPPTDDT